VNKLVVAAWDNMNVVIAIEKRCSKKRFVSYLLAVITRVEIQHTFSLLAFYINTKHSRPSDDISRLFGQWLPEGRPAAVEKCRHICRRTHAGNI
jgi:hypothetical protein